jgi:flagellar biosynthesis GTPase FlhF
LETKRFIGNDLSRLYERVRREFGPDAVIVRTRSLLREGAEPLVELIAAPPQAGEELALDLQWTMVDGALGRLQIARPRATVGDLEDLVVREAHAALPPPRLAPPPPDFQPDPGWLEGYVDAAPAAPQAGFPPGEPAGISPAQARRRSRPLPVLDSIPAETPPDLGWAARPRPEAPRRPEGGHAPAREPAPVVGLKRRPNARGRAGSSVESALVEAGLSGEAARRVVSAVPTEQDPALALARCLELLDADYPDEEHTSIITIQGAPGSGRTTALLRMALDCADTGRDAVLLAADFSRAAARELIHAYGEATGLPVVDAMDAAALRAAVQKAQRGTCLFADVPAGAFAATLPPGVTHHAYLAVPTHWQRGAVEVALGTRGARFAGCVFTFTDLATDLSPAVSMAIEAGLGIAFLSSGRDVGTGIMVAEPLTLASGILRTRTGETTDGRLVASA